MSLKEEKANPSILTYIIPFVLGAVFGLLICQFFPNSNGEGGSNEGQGVDLNTNLITNGDAITMINSFQTSNSDTSGTNESVPVVSGHLPKETLFRYMFFMDSLSQQRTGNSISGLEFYFANYGATIDTAIHKALPLQQTFVLYPTYLTGDGKHKAFDPSRSGFNYFSEIEILRDSIANYNSSAGDFNNPQTNVALNRSNMVPPRWN